MRIKSGVLMRWRHVSQEVLVTAPNVRKGLKYRAVEKGFKIMLLEKPMATTEEDCIEIVQLLEKNSVVAGVFHVLRGSPANVMIKETIPKLGKILGARHFEPVGHLHYAHSYVRGNWRRESLSSSFLLAKCCHDLDIIYWWFGGDAKMDSIESISSDGFKLYFDKENKPPLAGDARYCKDCPISDTCVYSAKKFYTRDNKFSRVACRYGEYDKDIILNGPYGRCVYECDNDVLDTQQVNIKFKDGPLVDFAVFATTLSQCSRETEVFGTLGQIKKLDEYRIEYTDFESKTTEILNHDNDEKSPLGGHGGCDGFFLNNFLAALGTGSKPETSPDVTLVSHQMAFTAEKSRKSGQKIKINL